MAKFVLIVFFGTYSGYTSVTMHDFWTLQNCEAAKTVIVDKLQANYGSRLNRNDAICMEK